MSPARESRSSSGGGRRRRTYLDALDIDEWVRRDVPAAESGARAEPAGGVAELPANQGPSAGAAVTFRIHGFRLGQALALVDERLWPQRRFFLDIAHAMNRWRPDRREDVQFEWPQLLAPDAGIDAAGRAFRAFVAAQSEGGVQVLAVGARVAELLGPPAEGEVVLRLDRVVDGADRRDLWRRVLGL